MAQLFGKGSNALARFTIWGGLGSVAFVVLMAVFIYDSEIVTGVGIVARQPIDFSHKHHVSEDGLDCRYCHTTVEYANYAGMPATDICMTCHSELYNTSPMLEPVRRSYQTNESIAWEKMVLIHDYVYFNHGAHVNHGIGCSTCHGRVDTMALLFNVNSFRMDWCIACHRRPQLRVRPPGEIFNMEWEVPANQAEIGKKLVKFYGIPDKGLIDCYTCHR